MKPLIVALDVDTEKEALALIRETRKNVDIYKVGPTLILRYGPEILKRIRKSGKKIFPTKIPRYSKHDGALRVRSRQEWSLQSHRPQPLLDCTRSMRWSTFPAGQKSGA